MEPEIEKRKEPASQVGSRYDLSHEDKQGNSDQRITSHTSIEDGRDRHK